MTNLDNWEDELNKHCADYYATVPELTSFISNLLLAQQKKDADIVRDVKMTHPIYDSLFKVVKGIMIDRIINQNKKND